MRVIIKKEQYLLKITKCGKRIHKERSLSISLSISYVQTIYFKMGSHYPGKPCPCTAVGRVWIKWGKGGEFRQILKKKKILFAFKGYTCRFKSEAFASFASIALRPCPVGLLFLVFGNILKLGNYSEGRRGRMVVEFTTTCTY